MAMAVDLVMIELSLWQMWGIQDQSRDWRRLDVDGGLGEGLYSKTEGVRIGREVARDVRIRVCLLCGSLDFLSLSSTLRSMVVDSRFWVEVSRHHVAFLSTWFCARQISLEYK